MDNKRLSKKREIQAANDIGGKAHTASGALWHKKSDFSNDMWNLEDKFTHEDKYSIQYSILRKIENLFQKVGRQFPPAKQSKVIIYKCLCPHATAGYPYSHSFTVNET